MSQSRPIRPAPTAIAGFVGPANRGPATGAIFVSSYSEFERVFGGSSGSLGQAIRLFFQNGGRQALVVRVHRGAEPSTAVLAEQGAGSDGLRLVAANPGAWGNDIRLSVDSAARGRFEMTVRYIAGSSPAETFSDVSLDPADSRYLPALLDASSSLVRIARDSSGSWTIPSRKLASAHDVPMAGGSDGSAPTASDYVGSSSALSGLQTLGAGRASYNQLILARPTPALDVPSDAYRAALRHAHDNRAILLVDPGNSWGGSSLSTQSAIDGFRRMGLVGEASRNAAAYVPMLASGGAALPPSGAVAGVMARIDSASGPWKAPAGSEAMISGIDGVSSSISASDMESLNPAGVNTIRSIAGRGVAIWGARTMRSAESVTDEYAYLSVRRLALFIERSIDEGTRWVVYERNDESLWQAVRQSVGDFLDGLFRRGAFQGSSSREAYFVRCGLDTMTRADVANGIVDIQVGVAPLKPAEFVVIRIRQGNTSR